MNTQGPGIDMTRTATVDPVTTKLAAIRDLLRDAIARDGSRDREAVERFARMLPDPDMLYVALHGGPRQ